MPATETPRANEFASDELNTVCLAGTIRGSESKADQYALSPPLRRTMGTNQALTVMVKAAAAAMNRTRRAGSARESQGKHQQGTQEQQKRRPEP